MKKTIFFLFSCVISITQLLAQSANTPLSRDYYHLLDRYEIKSGELSDDFYTAEKPYQRIWIADFVDSIRARTDIDFSEVDQFNFQYLSDDNWEFSNTDDSDSKKPIAKHFFRKKPDFYSVNTEDFKLRASPILYLSGGKDSEDDATIWTNTRGVEVSGIIDGKVGFYSFLGENQAVFPSYVRDRVATDSLFVIPGEGFWKSYKDNGYDFFTARGYVSFNATKHIHLQFGYDKQAIGNGYRSVILSDYSPNYAFLKINTKVWKFNYMNLFTQLKRDTDGNPGGSNANRRFPNKYMALHHLSINLTKNFNLGVFEAVVLGADDTTGDTEFDPAFLNPIIFYRALEQQDGSNGNALLGIDMKWNLFNRFSAYGQIIFDEFKLDEITAGDGWWANKFAGQIGVKYIDALGISNLDLQLEHTFARPFTYSHGNLVSNYSHYKQPLAHPLGSNFKEIVAIARYQPLGRLSLTGKIIAAKYGTDPVGENFGSNILKDNTTRPSSLTYGNEIGQGVSNDLIFLDFTASYQLKHNIFVDLKQVFRKVESDLAANDSKTVWTNLAFRWNIPQREQEF